MPYCTTIHEHKEYIRVEVSGERIQGKEVEDIASVWSGVTDVCRELNINKILWLFFNLVVACRLWHRMTLQVLLKISDGKVSSN